MRSFTIKNIPDEIYEQAAQSAEVNFRSINQELLYRIQQSLDLEHAAYSSVHQKWIDEALSSGEAKSATAGRWKKTLERGLARGRRGNK